MIRQNKGKLVISSIIIMLPALVGVLLWDKLPEQMTTHWGADGAADGWSSRGVTVWLIPVLMLVMHWICLLVTAQDPKNKEQSRKVQGMVFWIMPGISIVTSAIMYLTAFGRTFRMIQVLFLLIGLMFVLIGNYLPKCKQNHTIGIKVVWTLNNEENWNRTHRLTGKLWVIGGLCLMLLALVPSDMAIVLLVVVMLVLSVIPFAYSYAFYRKQLKEGTATKADGVMSKKDARTTKIASAIGIGILILAAVLMVTGNVRISYGEDSFTVEATYWEDITVDYAEIDSVGYREQDTPGSRINGFGSPRLLMGTFQNEEFGTYTRYSYTGSDRAVVLEVDDRILVLNGPDEESTRAIYEELSERTGSRE